MKRVQFKKQDGAIEIKIKNDAKLMETKGWRADVLKGKSVSIYSYRLVLCIQIR